MKNNTRRGAWLPHRFFPLALALVFVLTGGLLYPGGQREKPKVFTIFTWADMFPPEVLAAFETETGYAVNYVNFEDDETMLTRLENAGGGDYDLIIADDYIIETVIAKGLAAKLDPAKLTRAGAVNPVYRGQFYDPRDEYTVPYGAGVQTIVYDPRRLAKAITGYADLWDPSLRERVGIIGNFRVINGMALKVLGESYNTNDLGVIRRAGEKLLALAPNIRLIRDDRLQDELISGEISAAVMYTSQVTMALMEDPELKVVFPKEGIGFGIMGAFIPAKAPNSDAAYAFLNYIMEPERGARCFEYLGYYSTFAASDPRIAPEYRPFLTLPPGFNTNMEMIQNVSPEAEEEHSRIWTAFKEAAGKE